jgi:hypothetical protein
MTLGADLDTDLFLGGLGLEGVPAGTGHHALLVFGMNSFLHGYISSLSGLL